MSAVITTKKGYQILVDAADVEWLRAFAWEYFPRHRRLSVEAWDPATGKKIQMHRLIVGAPNGHPVDHANGNFLDNRRANLRICTLEENARNRRANARRVVPFKGVTHHLNTRFKAYIYIAGKYVHLGVFDTAAEGARAYDDAAREHFGAFACVNFPGLGERSAVSHIERSTAA